jgi:hypothetical protein
MVGGGEGEGEEGVGLPRAGKFRMSHFLCR